MPNTMGGKNGSWTRTCVATAPPRYAVVRIAPSTAVRGIEYKTTQVICRMPMGTRVCCGYPNLPVNASITFRLPVSLTTPLNSIPRTGSADAVHPAQSQERRWAAWAVGNELETSVMNSPSQGIPSGDPRPAYRCPRSAPVANRRLPLALAPRERERGGLKTRRAHPLNRRGGPMRWFPKAAGVLACLLIGCPSGPQPTPQPQPIAQPQPAPAPAPTPPPRETPAEVRQTIAAASIYFDYDSSTLSGDSRSKLQSFFAAVQNRADLRVRIEGNCVERGHRDYNL